MKRVVYGGGNYSDIYHGLSLGQLVDVINTDTLSSRHHPAVCMTRSRRFAKQFLNSHARKLSEVRCVLVLDKEGLSSNYSIEPVSDNINQIEIPGKGDPDYSQFVASRRKTIKSRNVGDEFNKAEERCYRPIKNISKYIRKIMISDQIRRFNNFEEVLDSITNDGFTIELF